MFYCSNCGKESKKKVCPLCGVKQGKTRQFCPWCGRALDPHAVLCPDCKEPTKKSSAFGKAICIILGVFLIIAGLMDASQSIATTLCMALAGILLLPITSTLIKKSTHTNQGLRKIIKPIRIIVIIVLIAVGANLSPSSSSVTTDPPSASQGETQSPKEIEKDFRKTVEAQVSAYIFTHYDVKPGYRVNIVTVEQDDDEYTAYGKVTVTDNYGDSYTGNFTATYRYRGADLRFSKVNLEVDDLAKD